MPLDSKKTAMSQGTNDCARHEAFSELYNLSHTRKEDFIVPEIAIVGVLLLATVSVPRVLGSTATGLSIIKWTTT